MNRLDHLLYSDTLRAIGTATVPYVGGCSWLMVCTLPLMCAIWSPPVLGHGIPVPWLQPGAIDQNGIYLALEGPSPIRKLGPITLTVLVLNVEGPADAVLNRLDLLDGQGRILRTTNPNKLLVTYAAEVQTLKSRLPDTLLNTIHSEDLAVYARPIAAGIFIWRVRIEETELSMLLSNTHQAVVRTQASIQIGSSHITSEAAIVLARVEALPTGCDGSLCWLWDSTIGRLVETACPAEGSACWFAGDQHVHTWLSIDTWKACAPLLSCDRCSEWAHCPQQVEDFGEAARRLGLSWIIITDHSNVDDRLPFLDHQFYTQESFQLGSASAEYYTLTHPDFGLFYSQEMGVKVVDDDTPAHLLVYPYANASAGYIANPCRESYLWCGITELVEYRDCDPAQDVLNLVSERAANGLHRALGFIAHPFGTIDCEAARPWDPAWHLKGYAGLEIWSSSDGTFSHSDLQSLAHWMNSLLPGIEPPARGQLNERAQFPNKFPVGLGNSDAHSTSRLANTFTYCWFESEGPPQHRAIADALREGHCTAANGPLVTGTINGARIGEVAVIGPSGADVVVGAFSTPEFLDLCNYEIFVWTDGGYFPDRTIPAGNCLAVEEYANQITVPAEWWMIPSRPKFVNLELVRRDGARRAISNPIWLEFREMQLGITPAEVVVDGHSFATLTARVRDRNGNPAVGVPVEFDRVHDDDQRFLCGGLWVDCDTGEPIWDSRRWNVPNNGATDANGQRRTCYRPEAVTTNDACNLKACTDGICDSVPLGTRLPPVRTFFNFEPVGVEYRIQSKFYPVPGDCTPEIEFGKAYVETDFGTFTMGEGAPGVAVCERQGISDDLPRLTIPSSGYANLRVCFIPDSGSPCSRSQAIACVRERVWLQRDPPQAQTAAFTLMGPSAGTVGYLASCGGGDHLAALESDKGLVVWDAFDWTETFCSDNPSGRPEWSEDYGVYPAVSCAAAADIAMVTNGDYVAFIDTQTCDVRSKELHSCTSEDLPRVDSRPDFDSDISPNGNEICSLTNCFGTCCGAGVEYGADCWNSNADWTRELDRFCGGGDGGGIAYSPDASRLAYSYEDHCCVQTRLITHSLGGTKKLQIETTASPGGVAWSADSQLVAAGDGAGGIHIYTRDGGFLKRIVAERKVGSMAFSPDGRFIAAHLDGAGVAVFDFASGREVRRLTGPTGSDDDTDTIAWRSDSKVLFVTRLDSTEIHVFPIFDECPCVYDFDSACTVDLGDFSLIHGCWLCSSGDACWGECARMDFDCNGRVAGGDLGWFAGAWRKQCDRLDAMTANPSCWTCDGPILCSRPTLAAASGAGDLDATENAVEDIFRAVTLDLRITEAPPTESSTDALPQSLQRVIQNGERFFAQVWVRDRGAQSRGLSGAFVDLYYTPSRIEVVSLEPGAIFTLFAEPVINNAAGSVKRVGGATLEPDIALDNWALVSVVQLRALTDADPAGIRLRLSLGEAVARRGVGTVSRNEVEIVVSPHKPRRHHDVR